MILNIFKKIMGPQFIFWPRAPQSSGSGLIGHNLILKYYLIFNYYCISYLLINIFLLYYKFYNYLYLK